MYTHDGGGGGSSAPKVTSNVTVDPGEIRAFAKFLGEMETELKSIRTSVNDGKSVPAKAFGAYYASEGAAKRHTGVLDDEVKFLDDVVKRMGQIGDGTTELSKIYNDLAELNQANSDAVSAHLKTTASNK